MSPAREAKPMPYMHSVEVAGTVARQQRTNGSGELGWRLRVHDPRTGKQPEQTFYGSYEQAVRELARLTAEVSAQVAPRKAHAKAVTVGDWIEEWLAGYAWRIPPSTNGNYPGVRRAYSTYSKAETIALAQLAPALGEKTRLSKVDHQMLLDAISGLTILDRETKKPTGTPLAESSMATAASVARAMFRDAVTAGVLPASPAVSLPTNWGTGATRRTALIPSILDVEKLAKAMDESWPLPAWARDLYGPKGEGRGDLVRIIAFTGMRISELFGLPAYLVDLDNRVLSVRDTVTESGGRRAYKAGMGKTEAALRHLAVVDQAVPAVQRLEALRARGLELEPAREGRRAARAAAGKPNKRGPNRPLEDRWLLLAPGEQGGFQSYGAWRKRLAVAKEESGVNYDAHSLRHVAVLVLYAVGESEAAIAEQIGHSDPKTTRSIYRHVFKVDRIEMARRVSEKQALLTAAEMRAAEAEAAAEDAPTLRSLGELDE